MDVFSPGMPARPAACALSEPYPHLSKGDDAESVRLLAENYSAAASEMTALAEYMYQHSVLLDADPETADLLECIGIAEMNHATLLAGAIAALGGDPAYYVCEKMQPRWWSGEDANYARLRREIISHDIAAETTAAQQYRRHASYTENEQVRALLLRIARDEDYHAQTLSRILYPPK